MNYLDQFDLAGYEAQIRSLENEARALRQAHLDRYAQAALTGLLAYGYSPRELVVEEAFRIATLCLEERKQCS